MKKIYILTLMLALPLIVSAQLINADFEEWENDPAGTDVFYNKPIGWIVSYGNLISETAGFYFPAETASQNGDYAVRLGIWYSYTKDSALQTAPINSRPAALTGYFTYTNNQLFVGNTEIKDVAQVSVALTKWNEALNKRDTIGYGKIDLNESVDYSKFTCPVVYTTDETPDSVTVFLDCSLLRRPGMFESYHCQNNTGSYFTVDNLKLEETLMGTDNFIQANNIRVFPNPAVDKIEISNFEGDADLFDVTGKLVLSQKDVANKDFINVGQLQKGIYVIKLIQGNNIGYARLIKD